MYKSLERRAGVPSKEETRNLVWLKARVQK